MRFWVSCLLPWDNCVGRKLVTSCFWFWFLAGWFTPFFTGRTFVKSSCCWIKPIDPMYFPEFCASCFSSQEKPSFFFTCCACKRFRFPFSAVSSSPAPVFSTAALPPLPPADSLCRFFSCGKMEFPLPFLRCFWPLSQSPTNWCWFCWEPFCSCSAHRLWWSIWNLWRPSSSSVWFLLWCS